MAKNDVESLNIGAVRTRKPRWVSTPPAYAGWWAVRLVKDHSKPEIIYFDGPRERSTNLEFSDRAYTWPIEKDESESDGTQYIRDWVRPTVSQSIVDDDVEYSEHTPTYWVTLGIVVGIILGVLLMFVMEWISIHHG